MKTLNSEIAQWGAIALSLIISGVSIYVSFGYYDPRLNADSFIVGVLSILVTILIGWQVWELVKIHNIRKEISDNNNSISTEIQRANKEIDEKYKNEIRNFIALFHAKNAGLEQHLAACFDVYGKNKEAPISKAHALDVVVKSFLELSSDEETRALNQIKESIIKSISYEEIEKMYHGYSKRKDREAKVNAVFTELLQKTD